MEPEDLLTLTVRMLDQLDLKYGVADDGTNIVIATEDDEALFIGTGTITDSTDRVWPALWLDLPLLTDVEATQVSSRSTSPRSTRTCSSGR